MLNFDLPFSGTDDAFQDAGNPQIVHALPDVLQPAERDGKAELSLVLHATTEGEGGGVFQGRFVTSRAIEPILSNHTWQLVPAQYCRAKLTPRSQVEHPESFGIWREGIVDGEGGLLVNFFLNAQNAQLMRQLALDGGRAIDLTVEVDVLGQVSGYAFLATLSGESVHDQLSSMLGDIAFSADEFSAAVLSLPNSLIELKRNGDGPDPGRESLLRETAKRCLSLLCLRTGADPIYQLRSRDELSALSVPLNSPRRELRTHRLEWSLSQFVDALPTEQQQDHFPQLRTIEPFSQVEINVLNHIPLEQSQAVSARVDLRFTGRSGTQETATLDFRAGDNPLKSVVAVYPSLTHQFDLESRLRLMLAPQSKTGFPRFWPSSPNFTPANEPFSVEISSLQTDVALIQIKALNGLFEHCSRIQATFEHDGGSTVAEVAMEDPTIWVVLTGHPQGKSFSLTLAAFSPNTDNPDSYVLHDGPYSESLITLSTLDVTVRSPTPIRCTIASDLVRFAVLDIRVAENTVTVTRVLRPGDDIEVPVWRQSLFEPLSFEWRVGAIREDDNGNTLPFSQSEWVQTDQQTVQIS